MASQNRKAPIDSRLSVNRPNVKLQVDRAKQGFDLSQSQKSSCKLTESANFPKNSVFEKGSRNNLASAKAKRPISTANEVDILHKNGNLGNSCIKCSGNLVERPDKLLICQSCDSLHKTAFEAPDYWSETDSHMEMDTVELVPTSALMKLREFDRPLGDDYTDALMQSVKENGITSPITIGYNPDTQDLWVQEGNHRIKIADQLGIEFLPAKVMRWQGSPQEAAEYEDGTVGLGGGKAPKPYPPDQFNHVPGDLKPSDLGLPSKTSAYDEDLWSVKETDPNQTHLRACPNCGGNNFYEGSATQRNCEDCGWGSRAGDWDWKTGEDPFQVGKKSYYDPDDWDKPVERESNDEPLPNETCPNCGAPAYGWPFKDELPMILCKECHKYSLPDPSGEYNIMDNYGIDNYGNRVFDSMMKGYMNGRTSSRLSAKQKAAAWDKALKELTPEERVYIGP